MAESAVTSLGNLLGKLLVDEGKYLWGAEEKVDELQNELLLMRSFLREADTIQHQNEIVSMHVDQAQKYVSEAQHIIDKFAIKVVSRRQQSGLLNKLRRYSCIFKELYHLHQAASNIDSLTIKISTLSTKLENRGFLGSFNKNIDHIKESPTDQIQQILKNVHREVKNNVGLEENAKEIITVLKSSPPGKGFHAIYGMAGLGKTTLATKVFEDDVIKQHFCGGQAFVYISKQFKVESVHQEILKGLNSWSPKDKDRLVPKLHEVLKQKKCLVVLDDVRTKEAWDSLKSAFTPCVGNSGSKVLLTTRRYDVANHVDMQALQKPNRLKHPKDWELLKQKMEWHPEDISTQKQDTTEIIGINDDCAKMDLAKKMLEVCKGVPLAIVVLGGILKNKKTLAEWESVSQNISSQLIAGYDHGRSCMEILLHSYVDLPYHLKSCFLHLANFPEDYQIWTENLYWMWVAEGLVTRSTCDRTAGTKSLEEVANDYLTDLAKVGLVEVVDRSPEGWIQSIRMHDLVRGLCLEKATADNFLQRIDLASNTPNYYNQKILLRMAVFLTDGTTHSSITESISSKTLKYLKSLLFIPYGNDRNDLDIGECQKFMPRIFSKIQCLHVLILKDLDLRGSLSSQFFENLVHLRYLSLRGARVSELPSSIGNLTLLKILDLRVLIELIIPNTLWKLCHLQNLLFPDSGYEIKRSEKLRVDTLICLEMIRNLLVRNLRTKDMVKIKNLRELSISDAVSKEAISDIIHSLKSSRLRSCSIRVEGNALSKDAKILSAIVCRHCCLEILEPIEGQKLENVKFPQYFEELVLHGCKLEDDPMSILGSLFHLKTLKLGYEAYFGRIMSCGSTSFPLLEKLDIEGLPMLEALELENGSMPKLVSLEIRDCSNLKRVPNVLPLSLQYVSLFVSGTDQDHPVDLNSSGVQTVNPCGEGGWLLEVVLRGKHKKVVLLGKAGAGKATNAMKLYCHRDVNRHFDAVARTWVPRRRSCSASSGLLPRRNLEQLLRDLRDPRQSRDGQDLSRMGCDDLMAELQQVMQQRKCLVILLNLEVDFDRLDADLEKTFGWHESYAGRDSKLVITSQFDKEPSAIAIECHLFHLRPLTQLETWKMIWHEDRNYWNTNTVIKWNLMRHCLVHPLSAKMFAGLLKVKESIQEWGAQHKELTDPSPIEFSQIFALCYDDLPLHLRRCLIHLASFPQEVEKSTKKLYQMWIAAGFVVSNQDEVQTKESLENLASSYLSELVQRGMVTALRRGPANKVKTCQLEFALRDLCLQKAEEDHMPVIIDQIEHAASTSNANLKTQPLSIHFISSPTSLLFFPDVNDSAYNEEKWEWLLYICNHFDFLRVLDLERMWLTKGSLSKEIGRLKQLRYLSLKGTWVTQLPQSIEDLINLQTLDLRVMEFIIIPDVLWKLDCLTHLYLPDFIAQETAKLRLSGLNCLETLVNLHTDKVFLTDLLELGQLRKLSIRKIHAVEVVDELDDILNWLSTSLEVGFNSEIINVDQAILSRFKKLHRLKIKGMLLVELNPEMFPINLEEVTLKHTKLEEDPLPVLEKLRQLRSLILEHDSYLGKEMTFSKDFYERATKLVLCSLNYLEIVYSPEGCSEIVYNPDGCSSKIDISGCWRVEEKGLPTEEDVEVEDVQTRPRSFSMSSLKKGFKSLTCR